MIGRVETLSRIDKLLIHEGVPEQQRVVVTQVVGEMLDLVEAFRSIAASMKYIAQAQLIAAHPQRAASPDLPVVTLCNSDHA